MAYSPASVGLHSLPVGAEWPRSPRDPRRRSMSTRAAGWRRKRGQSVEPARKAQPSSNVLCHRRAGHLRRAPQRQIRDLRPFHQATAQEAQGRCRCRRLLRVWVSFPRFWLRPRAGAHSCRQSKSVPSESRICPNNRGREERLVHVSYASDRPPAAPKGRHLTELPRPAGAQP
jgi:hypothetical protein